MLLKKTLDIRCANEEIVKVNYPAGKNELYILVQSPKSVKEYALSNYLTADKYLKCPFVYSTVTNDDPGTTEFKDDSFDLTEISSLSLGKIVFTGNPVKTEFFIKAKRTSATEFYKIRLQVCGFESHTIKTNNDF